MQSVIKAHTQRITKLAAEPILVEAVQAQNAKKVPLADIKALDARWVNGDEDEFALSLQQTAAGRFLTSKVDNSLIYTEAFLCDIQGAVVAEFPMTSDYWQGDEAKFTEALHQSRGSAYVGPVEWDESTDEVAVQISVPVLSKGEVIGVLVVGLRNIEH